MSVYARLGVPEISRWRDGRLAVLARQTGGGYAEQSQSRALPGFPSDELAAALADYPQTDPARAVAAFCRRFRKQP